MSPQFGKWYPVNTLLPKLEKSPAGRARARVLVFTSDKYICEGCLEETFVTKKKVWKSCKGKNITVTAWMPLPDAPGARRGSTTNIRNLLKD